MAIDTSIFRELQETAGADFVVELVDTFLQEGPRIIADLRAAWHEKSADRFRRAAHSLKSNGMTFGATDFAALARQLETGGLPDDIEPLDNLQRAFDAATAELKELAHG
ncbi:Hpt domain-containing protein [Ramlibacter albus]|uniref:Hpt domain-containing protein n=1 Tax=Ramlibacter albus TaxID=2079448 RepID=A0A923MC85_9BURK|nr:Hpt domain-containing protein [Ramlibacter albus]MBC5767718.1 Hpt domain-containing protein [Ramlibacter albus]